MRLNPLRLPLDRGRDKLAPPQLEEGAQQSCGIPTSIPFAGVRGGREGFKSVMIYGKINNPHLLLKYDL
jgi:hypothetical protein